MVAETLSRDKRVAHTTKQRIPHMVRWLSLEDGLANVSSASNPTGRGHDVDVFAGTCGCKGFTVYKTCSHISDARAVFWTAMVASRTARRKQGWLTRNFNLLRSTYSDGIFHRSEGEAGT